MTNGIIVKDLKESDVGREVVYTAYDGHREYGYISSWRDGHIWVRYGKGSTAARTDPTQLAFTG